MSRATLGSGDIGASIRDAVHANIDALGDYAVQCGTQRGHYRPERLWTVQRGIEGPFELKHAVHAPRYELCLGMGGEIVNSFVTLYELAYFFECAFLAAVATCLRAEGLLEQEQEPGWRATACAALLECGAHQWERYLREPTAAVIASLDADIIPIRYGKHQLWGVPPHLEAVRCENIKTSQLAGPPDSHELDGVYWIDRDKEIARTALHSTNTIAHAKAVQYFIGLQPFAADMGIDLSQYPLLFNFVPKAELLSLGPTSHFIEVLDEIHSPRERLKLRAITGRTDPWAMSFSCPQCGQASKRVIQTILRPDGRTIEIRCNPKAHRYQNELGSYFTTRGCGARSVKVLEAGPQAVYDFIVANDITLYYPVKQILAVLRSSHDTPIALPCTDIGVIRAGNGWQRDPSTPRGFGDHLDMLTSCAAVERAFLSALICPSASGRARADDALVSDVMMILAYEGRSPLTDPSLTVHGEGRPVTDTSAGKARQSGASTLELFRAALDVVHFDLDTLLELRTIRQRTWAGIQLRLQQLSDAGLDRIPCRG